MIRLKFQCIVQAKHNNFLEWEKFYALPLSHKTFHDFLSFGDLVIMDNNQTLQASEKYFPAKPFNYQMSWTKLQKG